SLRIAKVKQTTTNGIDSTSARRRSFSPRISSTSGRTSGRRVHEVEPVRRRAVRLREIRRHPAPLHAHARHPASGRAQVRQRVQGQQVALLAEARDHPHAHGGEDRRRAELLPGVDVRDEHLDARQQHRAPMALRSA
ncbi:MAG: hypothetical protein MZV63_60115, partial [Marinilabiliales bacterium]|nr:hypothetical protein [Marinilabiliales bacterium]